MNKLKKLIIAILGVGTVSAAGYEALPSDVAMDKVQAKYEASQTIKSKYALTDSQFVKEAKDKNHVKVEIGEAGKTDFEPSLTFSRWNGEAKFKIKPNVSKVKKSNKKIELAGENIKYKAGKVDYVFYDKPDASEDGGFEFEIVLNEKPSTNTWIEEVESTGVEFFKQKPLNEEQQEEGTTCTATECKDAEGNITASRPDNIVNSIAVYSNRKSGDFAHKIDKSKYTNDELNAMVLAGTHFGKENEKHQVEYFEYDIRYGTGKVSHINRIKAIDANGDWTWCDQNIANGLWTKTCPQDFLDKAVYPVVVDPTFGYTTLGGSNSNLLKDTIRLAYYYISSSSGTLTSLSAGRSASALQAYFRPVMSHYDEFTFVDWGTQVDNNTTDAVWLTGNFSQNYSVNNTDQYLPGIWIGHDSIDAFPAAYDSGVGFYLLRDDYAYHATNNPPATFTQDSSVSDRKYSIYATYQASSSSRRFIMK